MLATTKNYLMVLKTSYKDKASGKDLCGFTSKMGSAAPAPRLLRLKTEDIALTVRGAAQWGGGWGGRAAWRSVAQRSVWHRTPPAMMHGPDTLPSVRATATNKAETQKPLTASSLSCHSRHSRPHPRAPRPQKGAPLEKAHFTWVTEAGRQERWIVATCGTYTVLWNFRSVKVAEAAVVSYGGLTTVTQYHLVAKSEDVVDSVFMHDQYNRTAAGARRGCPWGTGVKGGCCCWLGWWWLGWCGWRGGGWWGPVLLRPGLALLLACRPPPSGAWEGLGGPAPLPPGAPKL